ncbi:TetR/AcrR family transcriptional regulator [Ktedonosporobacter rubrisoli]|uniref:TetR/AcrR family transcriptional regulator n=1 Tax=Ktedonosporobacter rubrisoli TaxID=2509675 RepID=A0A4P6JS92_KTERU|nr:TetR/AcrR family transcriptional regulator [Ktedonosporobacter rubrisoli]QBD78254.1 TetR/AcrR family transcriptional regulator [Ktedonosporobacter rubrisoli]
MDIDTDVTSRGVGRPRSTQAQQAVLAAALHLVKQVGFSRLSIEGIAREAGVGKPTIYRWWPSKGAIVFDALLLYAQQTLPLPPEGPLPVRLEAWLKMTFSVLSGETGEIVRSLMAEAQHDPAFAAIFRTKFILLRRQPLLAIIEEGRRRGELPADSNGEVMADLIYGAMWYRLLVQHAPLDDKFAHDIVHTLFSAWTLKPE